MNPVPHRGRLVAVPPPPGRGATSWGTDPYADALRNGHGPLFLRRTDGWLLPLDVERRCANADAADLSALGRCEGPVPDVGCGPGRLVAELAVRGRRALGIDISETAVAHTLRLGGAALQRSVFDPLPGEGRWGTVLLLDGNIAIGGSPPLLLRRTAGLLAPGGLLIAETTPQDIDERVQVRLDDGRGTTDAGRRPPAPACSVPRPPRPLPGPGSAHRPCCGTRRRAAGSPSISGRPTAAPSCACAVTGRYGGRATAPSPRTATL
ncbi:class I SAM-dependent methyltransferase [Streptomyces sp. NPDC057575]|uniref:class I SAM-dependent methyltransferase n=1 Tax=unclassified Streptomyces TaxID=2593676 RepID=UPI0036913474